MRVFPVDDESMNSRHHAGETHGKEEAGTKGAEAGGGEARCKEGDNDKEAQDRDGGEVEEASDGVAEEGIVDRWEEGRDNHKGDTGIVQAPEEEVQAVGVAGQEVGEGATREAAHGPAKEHEPGPPWYSCNGLARLNKGIIGG